jgi:hypothetical protein
MESSKSVLKSKGIWGGIIAFASSVAIVCESLSAVPILTPYMPVISSVGALLSIFGRFTATDKLKL